MTTKRFEDALGEALGREVKTQMNRALAPLTERLARLEEAVAEQEEAIAHAARVAELERRFA